MNRYKSGDLMAKVGGVDMESSWLLAYNEIPVHRIQGLSHRCRYGHFSCQWVKN